MQMYQEQNNDIDLFSVFETIWDGKWKIILLIFISSVACISYLYYTPNSFRVTTKLQESNQDLYVKYKYLNNILEVRINYLDIHNNNKTENTNSVNVDKTLSEKFKLDNLLIFKMFIREFNDYEEMVTVLSENDYVKDKIKNLNDKNKRKALINFAKNFKITKPNKDAKIGQISFLWHDVSEGSLILNKALNLTLINVQKSLSIEIDNIAKSIELENQRKKDSLAIVLNSIKTINKLIRAKRIRYLTEQSDIAKELGIEKNQLQKLTFASKEDYPYYLRGFKAIDKELDLINSRSNEDNDLMSEGYFNTKRQLILIEKDIRSKQLRDANKSIKKDDISKWVSFNLELAEIENNKKTYRYIFFSIIISGILGIFYVLISKNFGKRKNI